MLEWQDGNDIRPLYRVPWIPGIHRSQDPELQADGYRELTARVIVETLRDVGLARPSTVVTITGETLLRRATLGVFDHWLDSDRKQFITASIKVVKNVLEPFEGIQSQGSGRLSIVLPDEDTRDDVIHRLEQAKPEDEESNLKAMINEPEPLFDPNIYSTGADAGQSRQI